MFSKGTWTNMSDMDLMFAYSVSRKQVKEGFWMRILCPVKWVRMMFKSKESF